MPRLPILVFLCFAVLAHAQDAPVPTQDAPAVPLPPIQELLHDVERNQDAADAARKDYTYRLHEENQELDGKGNLKKTETKDKESFRVDGILVNRTIAVDGRPLTPEEQKKESERIDKEVAKEKARRDALKAEGKPTDPKGNEGLTLSRILQLGTFTNERRVDLDGRPTIALDYQGDPAAKTKSRIETIFRDIVGTVWIDEQDRNIAQLQGHFAEDFKIAGGLFADVKKGSRFHAAFTKINDEAWLLQELGGEGKIRILLFVGFNGRYELTAIYKSALPAERIAGSVRSGLRYLRYSPELRAPLIRAFIFTFFVSSVWALLALVAKRDMHHQGAMGYGILNGSLGVGAVIGATTLARIRRRIDADKLLILTSLYYVATMLLLAFVHVPWLAILVLIGAGFCWTSTMSTFNVSVQLSVPGWVYARALGTYLMAFQGGMALGSFTWGEIAEHTSTKVALICAASGLAASMPFVSRLSILKGELPDLTPYKWKRPVPALATTPDPDDGPVRVSIDYRIPAERYVEFTHAIHPLEDVRLRGGAVRWGIYRDASDPEKLNETFIMESWMDYLRSRERMTAADQVIRERVWQLHEGPETPKITHQIWAREVPREYGDT